MAPDNESVTAPSGGISLEPKTQSGKWRNLILLAGSAAIAGSMFGFGVAIQYEDNPTLGSATRVEANAIVPVVVRETAADGLSGSGYDIITYFSTDGTLNIESGALLMGPNGAAKIALSGAYMKIGGLPQVTEGNQLEVSDTISGAQLKADGGLITTTNDGTGKVTARTATAATISMGHGGGVGQTGAILLCRKVNGTIGRANGCTALTGYCTTCD